MAFLYNKVSRRIVLILLTLFGVGSFWIQSGNLFINVLITLIGLFCLYFITTETAPTLILIFLSFTSAYALFVFLFYFNLPFWVIMLANIIIFGYIFTYLEQKLSILGREQLIYLLLFALIIAELFLMLSHFLISPINQSLIITAAAYLLYGFSSAIIEKKPEMKFTSYLSVFMAILVIIFLTSSWGGI